MTAEGSKRPISLAELARHDGSDPSLPIYLAIKGVGMCNRLSSPAHGLLSASWLVVVVFDVSKSRDMYTPGKGGYAVFAGKDASRALGMSSLKIEDCVSDYSTLDEEQVRRTSSKHAATVCQRACIAVDGNAEQVARTLHQEIRNRRTRSR